MTLSTELSKALVARRLFEEDKKNVHISEVVSAGSNRQSGS
jgi:hypothetical protein